MKTVTTPEQSHMPEEQQKPPCPLIGADSNVFNLIDLASRTLKDNGMADAAKEMRTRIMDSGSYDMALGIIMEYVEPVGIDEIDNEMEPDMNYDQTMADPY